MSYLIGRNVEFEYTLLSVLIFKNEHIVRNWSNKEKYTYLSLGLDFKDILII